MKNTTEDYSRLLNGRLPVSYLEFELADRIIELQKQSILSEVGVMLPTTEETELRLKQVIDKGFKENEVVEKREYSLGFRACYNWLKIKQMKAGN